MPRSFRIFAVLAVLAALTGAPSQTACAGPEFEFSKELVGRLEPDMQRRIAGLQYLLNAYQIKQFMNLPDHTAREDWIEVFWKSHDPTPTTAENERRTEHELRVALARSLFGRKTWPGWDKRGEVFIRYGSPDVRAKIHAEVTARKVHAPGELWFYSRFGMIIQFRDESLTGNYIYAINALGATQDMDPELAEFFVYEAANRSLATMVPDDLLNFYRATEFDPDSKTKDYTPLHETVLGPQQVRVTRPRMDRVDEDWNAIVDPDHAKFDVEVPSNIFIADKAREMATRFEEVLEETPTAYPFNFERKEFPFFFGVDQFKGGEGINRVEVNVELPIEPGKDNEKSQTRGYRAEAVFFDSDYNEVARENSDIVLPVPRGKGATMRLVPAQLVFSLSEDYYRVAVAVTEVRPHVLAEGDTVASREVRESAYRSTVRFEDFENDLAISDILFAQKIEPAEKQSPFIRGAMEVVPHPIRRYPRGTAVSMYFESYNLSLDHDGLSSYEVEYRIVPHSGKKKRFWDRFDNDPTVVSQRFQASGYAPDEPQYLSVKTENLEPGVYDFLVTLKDRLSQSVTYRRATFRIIK